MDLAESQGGWLNLMSITIREPRACRLKLYCVSIQLLLKQASKFIFHMKQVDLELIDNTLLIMKNLAADSWESKILKSSLLQLANASVGLLKQKSLENMHSLGKLMKKIFQIGSKKKKMMPRRISTLMRWLSSKGRKSSKKIFCQNWCMER